jgi:hypothetical protein
MPKHNGLGNVKKRCGCGRAKWSACSLWRLGYSVFKEDGAE